MGREIKSDHGCCSPITRGVREPEISGREHENFEILELTGAIKQ